MAMYRTRNILGGVVPIRKMTSAAAIVKGCLVNINTDGLLEANTTSDANPEKTLGWAASTASAASVETDYVPGYAGIQALMDFSGTYAATTHLGQVFGVTIASGVPTVDLSDKTNNTVKLMELEGSTVLNGKAWFEIAYDAGQAQSLEVA